MTISSRSRRRLLLATGIAAALPLVGTGHSVAAVLPYDNPDDMYRALDNGPVEPLKIGGGELHIVFVEGVSGLNRQRILHWIRRSALAVTTYFGRYPVRQHGILVFADTGSKISHGVTYGYRGAATQVVVGIDAGDAVFSTDWIMVHEMIHTALPNLPRRALWLQEGNATYVEPIARAEAGQLDPAEVWREAASGMPKGHASTAEGGMDGTSAWNRLYWGGATFWLLAEIRIYERTGGQKMLRDALRAINRASGGNHAFWLPEKMMQVADKAIGSDVLSTLYARFAYSAAAMNLDAAFERLGVLVHENGTISYDDRAPLAGLRKKMMSA